MNTIFGDLRGKGVKAYMDDIVVHGERKEEHDRLLNETLQRLQRNKMRVNPKKIQYCQKEVNLLGVTVDGKEQSASEIKKNEAMEYPVPVTIKELRRFLGLTGWFQQFIKDYARLTENLTEGLKGTDKKRSLDWTDKMQGEFEEMKRQIGNIHI